MPKRKEDESPAATFAELGLGEPLLKALTDLGYEAPTPIQSRTIPPLLAGSDLVGQAQTGTGKTAAFALPILQKLDTRKHQVQALVLTPTRELALQVSEAFHTYSKHLDRVRVLPVYGGQGMQKQLDRLQSGAQIVVGTPGRVMDHLRRGTLTFESLKTVVLDEADEMLRMGFIEDVEWILGQAEGEFQTALFSATMPREIRRIADRYLEDAVQIEIEHKTLTVPTVEQQYINVSEQNKLDALTRVLETERVEAALVFARTKNGAAELTEKLDGRGYSAEALHGDLSQPQREAVVRRLRSGKTEVVVATDVAARGLDVERISHVVNYDIPNDIEAYVHRIGRTGRAGREGKAILFVTPRQTRMLHEIERYTGQKITPMRVPSRADVAARRAELFKQRVREQLAGDELEPYLAMVEELTAEGHDIAEIAAAAARLAQGDKPLEVAVEPDRDELPPGTDGMVRLFIGAGRRSGVRPSDIVGAIANEADVPGRAIGAIDVYDRYTIVEVPAEYGEQVLERMARSTIRNQPVSVKPARPDEEGDGDRGPRGGRPAPRTRSDRPQSRFGGAPPKRASRKDGPPAPKRGSRKDRE
jgi:ATP-dependent RNA helicase DeaD